MAGFDIIALAVMGLAVVFGLVKGFFHQLFKTIAVAGAFVLLYFFLPDMTNSIETNLKVSPEVAHYAAVVGAVFVIFIFVSIIMHLLRKPIAKAKFGGLDKLLGGVLGAAKGAGLLAAITFALISVPDQQAATRKARVDFMKTQIFNDSWAAPRMVIGMGYATSIFQHQFFIDAEDIMKK
jgi:uncharacterized membrane protein required for colicin V production